MRNINWNSAKRRKVRKFLHKLQDGVCAICYDPLPELDEELEQEDPQSITFEHVYPSSKTCGCRQFNLLLTHHKCNMEKGSEEPSEELKAYHAVMLKKYFDTMGTQYPHLDKCYEEFMEYTINRAVMFRVKTAKFLLPS